MTNHTPDADQECTDIESGEHEDPRLNEPGRRGMPGETIDSVHNMPGQQEKPPPAS